MSTSQIFSYCLELPVKQSYVVQLLVHEISPSIYFVSLVLFIIANASIFQTLKDCQKDIAMCSTIYYRYLFIFFLIPLFYLVIYIVTVRVAL